MAVPTSANAEGLRRLTTSMRQVVKRVLPPRIVDWLRRRLRPTPTSTLKAVERDPGPAEGYIIGLETRLWSTGRDTEVEKLARVVDLTPRGSRARARGSMALARWFFSQGRADTALRRLEDAHPPNPSIQNELDLLRVDCHCELGHGQEALSYLSRMTGRGTREQSLILRVGHTRSLLEPPRRHGSGPMIEALNTVFADGGYRMIRRRSVNDAVGLGNIACDVPLAEPRETLPLVTVVVSLEYADPDPYGGISSLLNQSWGNLEILLVGGAEDQERFAVADESILDDARVVFASDGAPNLWRAGLDHASGDMVTGHLYGSWAHPQRIEAQARAMMADPMLQATVTSHLRVAPNLTPRPLGLAPRPRLVGPNPNSTMVRRAGGSSDEAIAAVSHVLSRFSPVSGELRPPENVVLVNEDVPLTLTVATSPSEIPGNLRLAG